MSTDDKIHIARMDTIKTQARLKALETMVLEAIAPNDRANWLARLENEERTQRETLLKFYTMQNPIDVH
jgi:hypothetical protein